MPVEEGPYIQLAAFCEKVLEEKDGTLSLIRVVDRIAHTVIGPGTPESMPPLTINLIAAIALKSGKARGTVAVKLRPEEPSGLRRAEISFPVLLEGEDRGVNLIVPIAMQVTQDGLYWFDVTVDGVLFTRMPLRVVYQPVMLGGTPPATG